MRVLWLAVVVATGCPESVAGRCGKGLPPCPAGQRCQLAAANMDTGVCLEQPAGGGAGGGSAEAGDAGESQGCSPGCSPWQTCEAR